MCFIAPTFDTREVPLLTESARKIERVKQALPVSFEYKYAVITLRFRRRHVKQLNLPFLPKELFPVIGLLGSARRLLEVVSRLLGETYRLRLVVMAWKTDCPIWLPSSPA